MEPKTQIKTIRVRLKDKHAPLLRQQASAVNYVWNYCNDLSVRYFDRNKKFLSAYDLQDYTNGSGKELNLHSHTIQLISAEYATRRKQFNKVKLKWRKSKGAHRSLGWVPVKSNALRYKNGQIWYMGNPLSVWDSYGLKDFELGTGSFSEDSRGRWYLNTTVKVKCSSASERQSKKTVGVDLGLKDFLTTSDGWQVEAERFYRSVEKKLAVAQRANKKSRVRALHAKVKNRRKDALHKLSTKLVTEYGTIFVGNVDSSKLSKTRMAKSVYDAGWYSFKTMLSYKSAIAGTWYEEVNESFSTQTCSYCGTRSGPKGLAGLGIREWICCNCGSIHDRDINAAKNILAVGHDRLGAGIPFLKEREGVKKEIR